MKGIYETAKNLNAAGLHSFEEEGVVLGDEEEDEDPEQVELPEEAPDPVQESPPVTPNQPTRHSMQTRSMREQGGVQTRSSSKLKVAMVEQVKAPKRPVFTDGTRKVTGNTTVTPIEIDDGLMVLQNEKMGGNSSLVNSALFIFSTCLNSNPGEPKTDLEALHCQEKDCWFASCVTEINIFLD